MRHGIIAWAHALLAITWATSSEGMNAETMSDWRNDVKSMFYHGFDNYMLHAFPEDEIRPVSCRPLTRDQYHPENIGLNDVLGNISLTLIDSLSTLAILASDPSDNRALQKFQSGVEALIEQYGDGTASIRGYGLRGQGFDVDSKVQVFETTIRGVGGLLSAHLFAVGLLPIRGYASIKEDAIVDGLKFPGTFDYQITWPTGWKYNGQLLRLAQDLAERLLPAFYSPTGIPYPRVNLRYGIPFYSNSPLNQDGQYGQCGAGGPEITETCSAGAGSLVLEFATLSRLTGDPRFETVAKRAFFAVWGHRSTIGLVGSGIDAESGVWTTPFTGIGAGIDSFYEYALKSHILLSGLDTPTGNPPKSRMDPNQLFAPLEDISDADFFNVWNYSHTAVKRNLYTDIPHPHYINVHLNTGSPHIFWIDSLSAYYPGLLALAGELEEATTTHLLYTALWTRYSALPERWSTHTGSIEGGLSWWGGRPELSESNYYLYQATKDPWYLHVGTMIVSDIKRRCWTRCGFSGLQDVRSGELNDRMESFFLGETTKYLFLLFDPDHPLNNVDSSFVFTTEGHPLVIPRSKEKGKFESKREKTEQVYNPTCPVPPYPVPFSISAIAMRGDIFHAAHFARLHLIPNTYKVESPLVGPSQDQPSISVADLQSPSNHTYFPWTLPIHLLPSNGHSSRLRQKKTFDIQFPLPQGTAVGQKAVRINEGILINSLAGLGLGLIRDEVVAAGDGGFKEIFRIRSMGNVPLGRDERVFIPRSLVDVQDPSFTKTRDLAMVDLILDMSEKLESTKSGPDGQQSQDFRQLLNTIMSQLPFMSNNTGDRSIFEPIKNNIQMIQAAIPVGLGAIPPPDEEDKHTVLRKRIFLTEQACSPLPADAARFEVIVMKRGGCSFSAKLASVPITRNPTPLVIIVSYEDDGARPLLDEVQISPKGLVRRFQVPMLMAGGGEQTYQALSRTNSIGVRRRYQIQSSGVLVSNLIVI